MSAADPLERFVAAQRPVYAQVLDELRAGEKRSHWMWFIFPQLRGLGHSPMAERFALASLDEARSYIRHPLVGPRLEECTALVIAAARPLEAIFGFPDDLKFRSSMTLFQAAASGASIFARALAACCAGRPDPRTLALLRPGPAAEL